MKLIDPIDITPSMIGAATTVAEPASSETAWASGGNYVVGYKRIRTATRRVYKCAVAHSGSTTPPELDTARWVDDGPTLRWAPFDIYTSTAATATTSLTYVLSPGFFNVVALYGLTGASARIVIKDAPGGTVVYDQTYSLYEGAAGWYEYLFTTPRAIAKIIAKDLPIRPTAELAITITAASGQPVGVGMIVVGDYKSLLPADADWGGTQDGATADPVTYSYINTDEFGTTNIKRRHSATGMQASMVLPRVGADAALDIIRSVLDKPVAWIATDAAGFDGLNVFGLGSARVRYGPNKSTIDLTVKGLI